MSIMILESLRTIAKYYRNDHELCEKIDNFIKTFPKPKITYDKEEVWISLRELEIIGISEYENAKKMTCCPYSKAPGLFKALCMQRSLMLRLLIRCPMRQRNIREMILGHNLKKINGKWIIEFKGDENKISLRKGQENIYRMDFPPDLIQQLEEFLADYRTTLSGIKGTCRNVFLSRNGTPYLNFSLNVEIKRLVYSYSEIPLNIHMIRTIWATEYITNTKDFITASIRLNDKVETVLKHYSHIYNIDVEETVQKFLKEALNT